MTRKILIRCPGNSVMEKSSGDENPSHTYPDLECSYMVTLTGSNGEGVPVRWTNGPFVIHGRDLLFRMFPAEWRMLKTSPAGYTGPSVKSDFGSWESSFTPASYSVHGC